jgi:transcriptional regulator of arginine metabolism
MYIYSSAAAFLRAALSICQKTIIDTNERRMKTLRQNAIRELVANSTVANQDELRQKLVHRGIQVTQATLSRDIHELRLSKGPGGYSLPGNGGGNLDDEDDSPPSVGEMIESFGLRVRQAMNQVVVRTVVGGAQPLAASLDNEAWKDVVGTLAGDDTVLIICADPQHASKVESRLRTMLES